MWVCAWVLVGLNRVPTDWATGMCFPSWWVSCLKEKSLALLRFPLWTSLTMLAMGTLFRPGLTPSLENIFLGRIASKWSLSEERSLWPDYIFFWLWSSLSLRCIWEDWTRLREDTNWSALASVLWYRTSSLAISEGLLLNFLGVSSSLYCYCIILSFKGAS
jgi:hypothetical protein